MAISRGTGGWVISEESDKTLRRAADRLLMGTATRSSALRRRIDWIAVWVITGAASGFAVLSFVFAATGQTSEWWGVVSSGTIAGIGGWMLITKRPNLVVALAIAVPIEVLRFRADFPDLNYAVLGVQFTAFGLLAATMRPDRWLRMSIATVIAVLGAFGADVALGNDDPRVLYHATATGAGIVFVAWVLHVTTRAAQVREEDLQNLIDAAPVPTIVVDYTETRQMLMTLGRLSPRALRAHLLVNPRVVRTALELRLGVRANEEWSSFYGRTAIDLEEVTEVIDGGVATEYYATLVEHCASLIEGNPVVRREHRVRDASGDLRWIRSTWKVPSFGGELDYSSVLISDVDVTTLKEAEAVLAEQIDSKDRFLASISHELRTPITAVAGFAQELAANLDTFGSDEARELLSVVAREATDVADIVDDLLVAARPDGFELTVAREPVGVADVIATVAPGHEVEWRTGRDVDVIADTGRVRQILRNLVTNAERHGGTAIVLRVETAADRVAITVSDDGDGISPELEETLFDAYARGTKDPGLTESFGLGLFISRRLALQMDGDLTHARSAGRTEFRLELPLARDQMAGSA